MVYIRPRVVKYQTENPDGTATAAIRRAISDTWAFCGKLFAVSDIDNGDRESIVSIAESVDFGAALTDAQREDPAHLLQVQKSSKLALSSQSPRPSLQARTRSASTSGENSKDLLGGGEQSESKKEEEEGGV